MVWLLPVWNFGHDPCPLKHLVEAWKKHTLIYLFFTQLTSVHPTDYGQNHKIGEPQLAREKVKRIMRLALKIWVDVM